MDEKRFNIVIVDAPNLLVEDFKPYWSAGQVGGWHGTAVHLPHAIPAQSFNLEALSWSLRACAVLNPNAWRLNQACLTLLSTSAVSLPTVKQCQAPHLQQQQDAFCPLQ